MPSTPVLLAMIQSTLQPHNCLIFHKSLDLRHHTRGQLTITLNDCATELMGLLIFPVSPPHPPPRKLSLGLILLCPMHLYLDSR